MPLEIPDRPNVKGAMQAYVRTHLPELDPTVTTRRGFIGGLVKALSSALHDWYVALKRYADYEPFPQTATGQFLFNGWWADITQLTRNPAAPAQGRVVIQGTSGTILTAGSTLTGARGTYTVDSSQAVVTQSLNITSLTRSGSTAIAETTNPHYLATGMELVVSGATQGDYNGTVTITVTSDNEFTYDLGALTPATPATGSPKVTGAWGNVDITATATGLGGNVDAGEVLTVGSAPVGLDSDALVTFGGIGGGSEIEDVEDFRARLIEALGTDFGMFSAAEIKIVAKQISGVTRVWVTEAQLYEGAALDVYEGQVKIAFVRDGDANIFPSSQEVARVKAHIVDTIMPAHTAEEDVMVEAPTPLAVNITFTALSPDTSSMRLAIRASLEQFFEEAVDYGTDIDEDAYRCAIKDAWDSERRQGVRSFTLSTPTGTIAVGASELPVLGTITWPS